SGTPAQAACSGVTVVVDFGPLGGGVRTGCASGGPDNGLAALTTAGFGYSFVPRQPGLVCQIAELPSACNGAPHDAHWAYYHAKPGGSWSFSTEGAATYRPAAGTVEGWAYGADRQPGISPPGNPPPAPPPAGGPVPARTTVATGEGSTASSVSAVASPTGNPDVMATVSNASNTPEQPIDPSTVSNASNRKDESPSGTASWVIGLVLVSVVAGLGLWKARRKVWKAR
ncbi:MAG: hypothetical protein H0T78_11010, partial [Longispora sp.]|nr:hypothetical protein [Longispora sp. (in: high G+C Gram-positive bacteria)]